MKKRLYRILAILICMTLSLSLLTGCGNEGAAPGESPSTVELSGTFWHYEDYYGFSSDGTMGVYDTEGLEIGTGTYEWGGSTGSIVFENGTQYSLALEGETLAVIAGDDTTYHYTQVDALPIARVEAVGGPIADTAWKYDIEHCVFYADGSVKLYSEYIDEEGTLATYDWDEANGVGVIHLDGKELEIYLGIDGLLRKQDAEDGTKYQNFEPVAFDDGTAPEAIVSPFIAGTMWRYDVAVYRFYENMRMEALDVHTGDLVAEGSYTWDTTYTEGTATLNGITVGIALKGRYLALITEQGDMYYLDPIDSFTTDDGAVIGFTNDAEADEAESEQEAA